MFEKRGTVDAISGLESRIFQIQQNISEKDNAVNRVATASAASSLKR
jgi:hypothetical protein